MSRIPRQRDSAISGRMLDCRISNTGIRQPVSFRQVVPVSPFCTGSPADGRLPVFVDGGCDRPLSGFAGGGRSGARISEECRGTAGRRFGGAEEKDRKRSRSANQSRSSRAPAKARLEQHSRVLPSREPPSTASRLKDPCGSVWRFSLEAVSMYSTKLRQSVLTEALLTATGRFLNLPPESPFRRPARCGSPFGKLPRPEADCKRLPARNPQQVVQAGRMGSAYPPSARAHPPAGRTRSRASRNTCALAPR